MCADYTKIVLTRAKERRYDSRRSGKSERASARALGSGVRRNKPRGEDPRSCLGFRQRILRRALRTRASRDIDQAAVASVAKNWANCRATLAQGQLIIESSATASSAIVPILDDDRLTGLLYVRTDEARFDDDRDRNALVQFARIAAIALAVPADLPIPRGGVELYLERTAASDVARQQLLVLLERNEWNIARVARLLRVTRPTIYNRLSRFGIERRHVPKVTAPKREPA
jgi:transcriptional regulator with GAF, ATPase, and Fis domain